MHRQQRQRSVLEQDMGILCYGDKGNVTVAQLMFSESDEFELCLLYHPACASGISTERSVNKMQMPLDMKINTYSWMTDNVDVPIGRGLVGSPPPGL